ncbi:MAG TPA: response regulator [Usitatibacteraceae bacterium]|nr:response regulator [Usitatibacteraceae bacterium]
MVQTGKGRVLCVDDEPNILRSLFWLLRKDFDVMTAPGGVEALALVRQNDFDVIISDQRMPGMTGVEFLREAARIAPRAMRILLTGYSDLQAVMRSVNESEVYRFINKPWHINELPQLVQDATSIARADAVPAPAVHAPRAEAATAGRSKILVVDDDSVVLDMARDAVPDAEVIHARDLASAVEVFSATDLSVIVADTRVKGADTTRLLKLVKNQMPETVTVVATDSVDAGEIIALINQGQIYRYLPKPIKAGFMKLVLASALQKHRQLRQNPENQRRHRVEAMASEDMSSLKREIEMTMTSAATPAGNAELPATFVQRLGLGFRRLFGG